MRPIRQRISGFHSDVDWDLRETEMDPNDIDRNFSIKVSFTLPLALLFIVLCLFLFVSVFLALLSFLYKYISQFLYSVWSLLGKQVQFMYKQR